MSLQVYSTPSLQRYARAACMAFAMAVVSLLVAHPCFAAPPIIDSISPIDDGLNQTITIIGSGFGTLSPYEGDSTDIELTDLTDGDWTAGYGNDGVGLNVESWSDTEIVLGGFGGAYIPYGPSSGFYLSPGDEVEIEVWNPATGSGEDVNGDPTLPGAEFDAYVIGTPEPPSILLMLSGLLGLTFLATRKRFAANLNGQR